MSCHNLILKVYNIDSASDDSQQGFFLHQIAFMSRRAHQGPPDFHNNCIRFN